MATLGGKTLEEMQSEIALLESKLEHERQSNSTKVAFKLKKKAPILAATAPEFVTSGKTPALQGLHQRTGDHLSTAETTTAAESPDHH